TTSSSLHQSTGSTQIRMDDIYRFCINKWSKTIKCKDIFTCTGGRFNSVRESSPPSGIKPGNHIFHPSQSVGFHSFGKADGIVYIKMTEMVRGKGNLITDSISYLLHIFGQAIQPFICDLKLGERVQSTPIAHIISGVILPLHF